MLFGLCFILKLHSLIESERIADEFKKSIEPFGTLPPAAIAGERNSPTIALDQRDSGDPVRMYGLFAHRFADFRSADDLREHVE